MPQIRRAFLMSGRAALFKEEEANDIKSAVVLRLLSRLHVLSERQRESIPCFREFVSRLTCNAVFDAMRNRFPERARLKNRLRHALLKDSRFTTTIGTSLGSGLVAGLRGWHSLRAVAVNPSVAVDQITGRMLNHDDPAGAMEDVISATGCRVALDDLIRILSDFWGVTDDVNPRPVNEQTVYSHGLLALEARQTLAWTWREIGLLPPRQRKALLLNLRDPSESNATALLLATGVATFDEIAAAIGMSKRELVSVWDDLPMEDRLIAERLDVTQRQVISLRNAARERLRRRMLRQIGASVQPAPH